MATASGARSQIGWRLFPAALVRAQFARTVLQVVAALLKVLLQCRHAAMRLVWICEDASQDHVVVTVVRPSPDVHHCPAIPEPRYPSSAGCSAPSVQVSLQRLGRHRLSEDDSPVCTDPSSKPLPRSSSRFAPQTASARASARPSLSTCGRPVGSIKGISSAGAHSAIRCCESVWPPRSVPRPLLSRPPRGCEVRVAGVVPATAGPIGLCLAGEVGACSRRRLARLPNGASHYACRFGLAGVSRSQGRGSRHI